jgi:hypothetical protein
LLANGRKRDLGDIKVLGKHELEQEVERSVEDVELDEETIRTSRG